MKKVLFVAASIVAMMAVVSCGPNRGSKKAESEQADDATKAEVPACPEYTVVNNPCVDLSAYPVDADGYYVIFDGSSFNGWRGYGKDYVPGKWDIQDGCLHFNGTGTGEAQTAEGGDIIFAYNFKNFELCFDWKVSKGGNSGVFYLAKEVTTKDENGNDRYEPIYISSPEYQILDNENHPDAKLGVDGNRQSASLYDMIPAKPQNQNPAEQWNTGKILVYQGTVVHGQNDANVVEYHLWTQNWTDLLQASKFSEDKWPLAFALLNNCGGDNHEGYIGFQDHGNDVWYRNIRIKVLD